MGARLCWGVARAQRIVVAMSGGVDSSVAAARLVEQGYEVVGLTLRLAAAPTGATVRADLGRPDNVADARRVADALGIAHQVRDCREPFERSVVQPFVEAYLRGRTPSPCVWCNPRIKFPALLELATELGIERVASGHYARIRHDPAGVPRLLAGRDGAKDQSYFLYMLPRPALERILFPLGESTKRDVRDEARQRGLPAAGKDESQELCFVQGDYADFVEQRAAEAIASGPLEDASGRQLGVHRGIHRFTLGQRKGLGVAMGAPAFVIDIDADRAAVRIGTRAQACARGAVVEAGAWGEDLRFPLRARVKVRSQHAGALASIAHDGSTFGRAIVRFDEPISGVSPGQAAVAYDGERVLGGGIIACALREGGAP